MNKFCSLCNQGPITSEAQWQQHVNGKKHKKNEWKNGVGMQYDLPDDKRSAFFVPSQDVKTVEIRLDVDDDLEELVKHEKSHGPALGSTAGYHSFEGMDFPSLGSRSQPADTASPENFPSLPSSSTKSVEQVTNKMAGVGLGRGRGRAKPSKMSSPGNNPAPGRTWSNIAQPSTSTASPASPPIASSMPPPSNEPRQLTQSEKTGNVRVIPQPSSTPSMPVTGTRPQAKAPKQAMAKRIYHEYKAKKKTASQAFQEIATNLLWTIQDEEVTPSAASLSSYAMRWIVNGFACEQGEGSKKKAAKESASRKALSKFANVIENPDKYSMEDEERERRTAEPSIPNPPDDYKRLTMMKVDELIKSIKMKNIDLNQPTRFAAFIITRQLNQPASEGIVVALGTGRYTNKMSQSDAEETFGYRLHDMQAAVLAKRAFQAYLYGQLTQEMQSSTKGNRYKYGENILEYSNLSGRYRLRSGVRVHLYLSHAPSGDATAYIDEKWKEPEILDNSELERDLNGKLNPDPVDIERGHGRLRLIIDSIRDETAVMGSRDATVMNGRLKIMSLSDKLLKWVHLGVQGGLLTHLLEPIFLHSIQMGCNYVHSHLARALLTRVPISIFPSLPNGYSNAADPFLGRPTKMVRLRNQIEGAVAWNWFLGTEMAEVIDCNSGLLDPRFISSEEGSECSRLSRITMLQRLQTRWSSVFAAGDVVSTSLTRRLRNTLNGELQECSYGDLKGAAKEYQMAKSKLYSSLSEKLLGKWVPKQTMQKFTLLDYEE